MFFLFNRTTLQVFVTSLTGGLYVHRLWFYKHQHDNRVRSKLFVACQWWWFQWRFWFVPSVPGHLQEEEVSNKNLEVALLNKKIPILLSEVYCLWQVVKTQTIILNNLVFNFEELHSCVFCSKCPFVAKHDNIFDFYSPCSTGSVLMTISARVVSSRFYTVHCMSFSGIYSSSIKFNVDWLE